MSKKTPNILLVTCDQLRFDFLGAYGCDFIQTPNIDRLAREGCLFENAYSPNPVCIPARHNLITGLTARHHGFDDNYFGGDAKPCPWQLPTFAQILNDGGYHTVAIGKMHFQPERRATGFDHFYNMNEVPESRQDDDYAQYLTEADYGEVQSLHGVRGCLYMQPQRSLVPEEHHGSKWVADMAIDYLRANQKRQPFLMWAGFIHPHPPLDVPDAWADLYRGKVPPPVQGITPLPTLAQENIQLACLEDPTVLNRTRELYAAAISYADHQLGRILDELERLNLLEDTLVVFTSDHGEMLGDLGTFQKFLPYDASSKIPLVVRWPDRVAAGTCDARFVDLNDLLPTFLDAAHLAYPADYDLPGESLFAACGVKNRSLQYLEHQSGNKRWCSLRDERYKYVFHYGDNEQLFDLQQDPAETCNLLCQNPGPALAAHHKRLRAALLYYEGRYGLRGYVVDGDFKAFPHYEAQPYFETNLPRFYRTLPSEEARSLMPYDEEVLAAIAKEPLVKLEANHTEEVLRASDVRDGERIQSLLRRAKGQGN